MTGGPHGAPDDGLNDELSAYLDGELDDEARDDLERRLATDADLAHELSTVAEVRLALRALPEVEPSAGALEEVVAAVRAVEALERRPARGRRLLTAGAMTALLAFVVAMVAVEPAVADATPDVDLALEVHDAIEANAVAPDGDDALAPGLSSVHLVGRGELIHRSARADGGTLVSMFSQPGEVEWGRMPADGEKVDVAGQEGWTTLRGDDHVLVIERDGIVVTLVSAAPLAEGGEELLALVDERAPAPDEPSWWERATAVGSGLGELVGLG